MVKHGSRLFVLFALLFTCLACRAQVMDEDTSTNDVFFRSKKFDSKCYVGFEGTAGVLLRKKAAMNVGINLNWVINHRLVVSGKYHVLTTPLNIQAIVASDQPGVNIPLTHHYGGLGFSYILFHDKLFSLQPELSAGWANVKYHAGNATWRKNFAMVIPAIYGIYNATKYFRLGIGFNYQVAAGCKSNGLKDADLSGFGGVLFMRVGTF